MIKVMEHYDNGGDVEASYKNKQDWLGVGSPSWDWDKFDYRIKGQKVTIEKWMCRDKDGNFIVIEISPIDEFEHYEKVKLIKSYEVEL